MIFKTISNLNIYLFSVINNVSGKNPILDTAMIFIASYFIFIIPIYELSASTCSTLSTLLTDWFVRLPSSAL